MIFSQKWPNWLNQLATVAASMVIAGAAAVAFIYGVRGLLSFGDDELYLPLTVGGGIALLATLITWLKPKKFHGCEIMLASNIMGWIMLATLYVTRRTWPTNFSKPGTDHALAFPRSGKAEAKSQPLIIPVKL